LLRGDHVSFSLVASRYFPIFPVLLSLFFSIPRDSGVIFGADGREWARVVCGSQ